MPSTVPRIPRFPSAEKNTIISLEEGIWVCRHILRSSRDLRAVLHYGIPSGSLRRRYTPVPVLEVQRQAAEISDNGLSVIPGFRRARCLLESVISSYDLVLIDEHCSDATLSITRRILARSAARLASFKHRNADDLKRVLVRKTKNRYKHPLIITDGVFNVTGEIAPIPEYYTVLSAFPGAALLIDDSDAFGVLGAKGRGTLEYFGYDSSRVNLATRRAYDPPTGSPGFRMMTLSPNPTFERTSSMAGTLVGEEDAGRGWGRDVSFTRSRTKRRKRRKIPFRLHLSCSVACTL